MKFAPKEIFEQILEWSVIPTFDLIVQYRDEGIVVVKRKIVPYKDQWALPGLRMHKEETIEDTLKRIAKQEIGIDINPKKRQYIGQYVGKFKTEHQRQDLSTGYLIKIDKNEEIKINEQHFYSYKIVKAIPKNMGAMYRFYLNEYWKIFK